jgi:hypothetical protein
MVLLAFNVIAQRRRARYANRAQQVVLACATFDPEGRLMVTPEGLLPNKKITNSFLQRVCRTKCVFFIELLIKSKLTANIVI